LTADPVTVQSNNAITSAVRVILMMPPSFS
jgi:hypothetical protein